MSVRQAAGPVAGVAREVVETAYSYRWVILIISTMVQTLTSFTNQSIAPLAPYLQSDLSLSRAQIGLLSTAIFGAGFIMVPVGWLADRFGVRLMFVVGLTAVGLFTALAWGAPGYGILLVLMALSGLGNAIAMPPTTRAIMYWFPQRNRGIAMSVKQTGVAMAGFITALSVPWLADAFGWRGTMLTLGVLVLVAAALAGIFYREYPAPVAAKAASTHKMSELFGNRDLLLLCGVSLGYGIAQLSFVYFLVLYLVQALGYTTLAASSLLAAAQLSGVCARIGWGVVSDKVFGGRRKVVMGIIGALTGCTALAFAALPAGAPSWIVSALVIVGGAGFIGWNGVNMTYVAELAGKELSATAAGLSLTVTYVGIVIGPPIFGWTVDVTKSYSVGFTALAAVSFASLILLSLIRGQRRAAA
ncbi:MAG: MFS transporter [Chloroflexi bacterium]|nr:MFS transporter [Chloroflexota bacterium]